MCTEYVRCPCVELVDGADSAADTLQSPDRKKLIEYRRALDRRGIYADAVVDVVCSSVGYDGTQARETSGVVVTTIRLHDVVLRQRVGGPAVNTEVAVSRRVERATALDHPGTTNTRYNQINDIQTCSPIQFR